MTNEQAAIKLQNILNDDTYSWHPAHAEALRMAIEALKVSEVKRDLSDMISRQALKAALADVSLLEWEQLIKAFPMLEAVEEMPSVQPSFSQDHENDHIVEVGKMDCISRQAAIDALARTAREKFNLSDEFNHYLAGLMDGEIAIQQLPSAEPEEDCDSCKYGYFGNQQCDNCRVGYPSHYERRTDEE